MVAIGQQEMLDNANAMPRENYIFTIMPRLQESGKFISHSFMKSYASLGNMERWKYISLIFQISLPKLAGTTARRVLRNKS